MPNDSCNISSFMALGYTAVVWENNQLTWMLQ